MAMYSKCSTCKTEMDPPRASAYCKPCLQKYDKARNSKPERRAEQRQRNAGIYTRNRDFVLVYLMSHPCVRCGESDPVVLSFDHLRDKTENVANLVVNASIKRLEAEIAKCQVLCMNCHAKKTAEEANTFRHRAVIAQSAERNLGKIEVPGSKPGDGSKL
jgi:5-methylcytosine-specific restriction endonuclease McrA